MSLIIPLTGFEFDILFLWLLCVLFLVANVFEGFLKFRDFARLRILMGGRHRDYVTKQNFRHHFAFFSIFFKDGSKVTNHSCIFLLKKWVLQRFNVANQQKIGTKKRSLYW